MERSIKHRLAELEAQRKNDPLIVLTENEDGSTAVMTMRDCIEQGGNFVKVIRGSNLKDLDAYLELLRQRAKGAAV